MHYKYCHIIVPTAMLVIFKHIIDEMCDAKYIQGFYLYTQVVHVIYKSRKVSLYRWSYLSYYVYSNLNKSFVGSLPKYYTNTKHKTAINIE